MVTSRRIAETDRAGIEQALARDEFHLAGQTVTLVGYEY
jgi:hypothetical protein